MELLKTKNAYYIAGMVFIFFSAIILILFLQSDWKISVHGLKNISEKEIQHYVSFYLKKNPDRISAGDIEEILKFHPRISNATVSVKLKRIDISIIEKNSAYLLHDNHSISEIGMDGHTIQEIVTEKDSLSEDLPIFYLTAEKDTEIETIRSDIIRLWEQTGTSHAFLWDRLSEVVLARDEMNNPEINFFLSFMPLKISFYNKIDINALRKLWAILYLVETEKIRHISMVRIYQDHAVME